MFAHGKIDNCRPVVIAPSYLLSIMQQNGLRPSGGIYKALDGQNSNLRWDIPTKQLQVSVLQVNSRQTAGARRIERMCVGLHATRSAELCLLQFYYALEGAIKSKSPAVLNDTKPGAPYQV